VRAASYRYEQRAWRAGLARVAGVDEAGRGPLAGPVVAAAVILGPERRIGGLADSKRLSPLRREVLYASIRARALAVGVGVVGPAAIDRLNVLEATRRAMRLAVLRLGVAPDLVITDFVSVPGLPCPQWNLVRADGRCATVAAASIVAKVTRDRLMRALARRYPNYGFDRHKGYATPDHLAALDRHGPCPAHRRRFLRRWWQPSLFPAPGRP
jgi:ribonuclease HII